MIHRRDDEHPSKLNIWTRLAEPKAAWPTLEDFRDRLDSVVPGEWDMVFENISQRASTNYVIKCRVQVLGVIREGVGEDMRPKVAREVAFREACALFGIGRQTPPE